MRLNIVKLFEEAIAGLAFVICDSTKKVGIVPKDDEALIKSLNEEMGTEFQYVTFEYLQKHHPMELMGVCGQMDKVASIIVTAKAKELLGQDNPDISIQDVLNKIKDELIVHVLPDHVDVEEESRELIITRPIEEVYEFSEITPENISKIENELSEIIEKVKESRKSTLKVNSKNRTLDYILQDRLGFLRIQEDWSEDGNTYMINLTSN